MVYFPLTGINTGFFFNRGILIKVNVSKYLVDDGEYGLMVRRVIVGMYGISYTSQVTNLSIWDVDIPVGYTFVKHLTFHNVFTLVKNSNPIFLTEENIGRSRNDKDLLPWVYQSEVSRESEFNKICYEKD